MSDVNEEYCVLCEAQGKQEIASIKEEFNGDVIHVCCHHHDLIVNDKLFDILDEQPDE